jgi:two-component sensor histidine kinase
MNQQNNTLPGKYSPEEYFNLTTQILRIINAYDSKADTISSILSMIKTFTGIEAIGIRLKEEHDFPYYETKGFPESFVEAERRLCAYEEDGSLIVDYEGNPYLECMCGNVICGKTNPSLPFFTDKGSFWTCSTTELLSSTTEEDRQARTINRCNGEGYESVALIPLSSRNEKIGLLQLNDKRRDMFTVEMINYLEGIAETIGLAYSQWLDFTKLKQTKEQIKSSLKEKEILLREIHHRVKNNLAVVTALVNLQAEFVADRSTRSMFLDTRNRIKSMALIHEELYRSKDYTNIDFSEYLRDLSNNLLVAYAVKSDDIVLNVQVENVQISIEKAVPLGLIVNELLSNSLTHAFDKNRWGRIDIELKAVENGSIRLRVSDNGRGIPDEIDVFEPGTIGLQIVSALVDQLEGTLQASSKSGTVFSLTF